MAILTAIGLLANCPVDRNLRGSPIDRGAGLRMTGGQQHDIVEANQCARRDCGCELASDYNPVCVEGTIILYPVSGLEPVISHTEKTCLFVLYLVFYEYKNVKIFL